MKETKFVKVTCIFVQMLTSMEVLGVIVLFAELILRFNALGLEENSLEGTPLSLVFMLGILANLIGIFFFLAAARPIFQFTNSEINEYRPKQGKFLFLATRRTLVSALLILGAWISYTLYLVVNEFPFTFLWTSFVPFVLILVWILLRILGAVRTKVLEITYNELKEIGKKECRREREEKKQQREQEIKEREKMKQKPREQYRPIRQYASTSTAKTIPKQVRLERLEQIVMRTREMRLTDLRSVLEFMDKSSLMKWLYALEEKWKFTIKGDFIVFEEGVIKKEELKILEDKPKILCLFCEAELQEVDDDGPIVCLNCGKKAPYCEICKNIIQAGQKVIQIKTCKHIFHKNHIVEWIKVKGTCPICKKRINEQSLEVFEPE